jgi:hypothetical protein
VSAEGRARPLTQFARRTSKRSCEGALAILATRRMERDHACFVFRRPQSPFRWFWRAVREPRRAPTSVPVWRERSLRNRSFVWRMRLRMRLPSMSNLGSPVRHDPIIAIEVDGEERLREASAGFLAPRVRRSRRVARAARELQRRAVMGERQSANATPSWALDQKPLSATSLPPST